MPCAMADQRALDAIAPDRAGAWRGSRPPPRSPHAAGAPIRGGAEQLRDAHQALRARVEGAIGQIDRLLETGRQR